MYIVPFFNICHLHWLFSARGYPREFPSCHSSLSGPFLPLGCPALRDPRNARGVLGYTLRLSPRVNPRLSLSIIPNSIRVFFSSCGWLCSAGSPITLVAFWGALCGSVREILLAFTPYTLHLTPQLCCLSSPLTSNQ